MLKRLKNICGLKIEKGAKIEGTLHIKEIYDKAISWGPGVLGVSQR